MDGENQFRDHAANERTMLAWVRTGVALMAFGFAIARFGLFLKEIATASQVRVTRGHGSAYFGVAMVVLGLVINGAATIRYSQIRKALLEKRPTTGTPTLVIVLGVGSVIVAIIMSIMLARTLAE